MDLTIRDWMVIIGALLILAVLVDAARRVFRERRSEVRLNAKINRTDEEYDDEEFTLSELPNGGARIVRRDDFIGDDFIVDPALAERNDPLIDETDSNDFSRGTDNELSDEPADDDQDLDDPVSEDELLEVAQPESSGRDDNSADLPPLRNVATGAVTKEKGSPAAAAKREDDGLVSMSTVDQTPETLDWLEELDTDEVVEEEPEAKLPRGVEPYVIVLNVVSRSEHGFNGKDILQILLACDLRFGDMDFFHRHEQPSGKGPIQFSVANMMKPGVFDIDAMNKLNTKGLMFFVTLPGPDDMLKAFNYMYETARTVAKNLGGDVLDETRSVVTTQSLEHMRQQIRELHRRMMLEQNR